MFESETPPATMEAADAALVGGEVTPESAPEAPAAEPAAAAPPAESAPSPEPAVEPVAEEAATDLSGYPPFTYTANGREYAIEGSAVGEDGILIPTAQVPHLTRVLAEAHQNRDFGRELGRVKADALREGQALKDEFFGKLRQLKEIATDPEKLAAWSEDIERNWALLEAQAKLDIANREKTELQQQRQTAEREAAHRELVPKCHQVLTDQVSTFMADKAVSGLFTAEDAAALKGRLETFFSQIFTEDEGGEVMVDLDLIRRELVHEAEWRRRVQSAASERQRVAAANAATKTPSPAPPTVGARTTTTPTAPAPKTYQTARDADEDIWGEGFKTL